MNPAELLSTVSAVLLGVVAFFLKEIHTELKSNTKAINQVTGAQGIHEERLKGHEIRLSKLEAANR